MGLFDIFRKKKNETVEQESASESTEILSESESNSDASEDEQSTAVSENTSAVTQPMMEQVGLVNEDEAKIWQEALDKQKISTPQLTETTEQQIYDAGLKKSRTGFADRFNRFLANFRSVDENFFEDLEETLVGADVGFDMAIKISDELREEVKLKNAKRKEDVRDVIIKKMVDLYEADGINEDATMNFAPKGQTTVILFVGVNGVGKTTTIGKLASKYQKAGKSVLLAAADTFRAGATKQLQEWGERAHVPVVAGKEKADPASVVFAAVEKARDENYDVLFVDTAGRLQNNVNLMQELEKMKRIIQREIPEAPHEVLLVLDATTGQNALQQAKLFKNSSDVSGIVLTKMDGTAKGGIVFAIRNEMHLPVKWIGFGEKASDLREFKPEEFVYGLFKELVES
ncbi:signal recognition particle-docking protein FtsY [Leuconostoc mesenteroides]|uniref:signal recognition particle-docking protein FtsY n=1 Tax=Leuconostoc mesenteroides TaxID=1245 RepID=UPI00065E3531|nr:signal recognition particle-docking protein FtsY [Leuconostoc mesenteroides]AKP35739.1 cell division protein FtsY [Leuconostoc mesenteroides subsp. dextranicum]MBZ1510023.1 signal recognition particle-docking protein FtsY [Leuconostoc mesenteroides]MBZ1524292.1 signal recognition particle-docking protein FtsY [Leuconostoc mesenteroides]ORI94336.1 signal recognition particle-docking protein FtsY [Leuconostoc mesenteroides subsp. mesenteroides]ORI96494.1 signal recognition particle-docking pr